MKRKRYVFYDGNERDLKKRRKFVESIEDIPFIQDFANEEKMSIYDPKEMKFTQIERGKVDSELHFILPKKYEEVEVLKSLLLPPTPEKKKKVGFSTINKGSDVERVFGKMKQEFPDWKISFVDINNIEEHSKRLQENYRRKLLSWKGEKEQDDRVYINDVIEESLRIARKIQSKKILVFNEEIYEGEEASGPIDYVVKCQGVVLVIVEAKKTGEYEKGVPQLLMQLKAVQESEGMHDKWYYGFAATKDLWTPCRLNMKHDSKVQIGRTMKIDEEEIGSFSRVLYMMKSMILRKFD